MISLPPAKTQSSIAPIWVASKATASTNGTTTVSIAISLPKRHTPSFAVVCRQIGQHLYRSLALLLLLIGLCTVFDEVIGDGTLPQLNNVRTSAPALITQATRNTTEHFQAQSDAQAWSALKPSRTILTALSPEITAWLYDLHHNRRIIYRTPSYTDTASYGIPTDIPLVAAYHPIEGNLYLGNAFWTLNDGQKVAVLAHEYRHFRQNAPKRFSRQLAQLIGSGRLRYASILEDEAFAYEKQAQAALGL